MGLFSSDVSPSQLLPFNPPIGVHPQFCVNVPTTLILKEKAFSFSGDDFSINDQNGAEVVKCKGKTLGFGAFHDPQGNHLFTLRTKLIAIHKTFVAERPDGTELFTVKAKFALMGSKMIATFHDASSSSEIELACRGNFLAGAADIAWNDRPVATISRKMVNAREVFGDKQTYYVTVAPGVDLALMAAIAVCFDEKEHEGK